MIELHYRRAWLGALWLLVLAIVAVSLIPDSVSTAVNGIDKLGHFLAYFLLALLGSAVVRADQVARVMLRSFLLGLALEAAQALLTTTRTAEWADIAANSAGVLAAWWLARRGLAGWAGRAEQRLSGRRHH